MKDSFVDHEYFRVASALEIAIKLENIKILELILSRQLPPQQYNGILNFLYINLYENATSQEVENALVFQTQLKFCYGFEMHFTNNIFSELFVWR